jgi:hypothetical protein
VKRVVPLLVALAAVAVVLVPYVALGGGSYEPAAVADPCAARDERAPDGVSEVLEQIVLTGLDRAACDLGVSREELVLAVRSEDALQSFAGEQGLSEEEVEQAVQEGLVTGIDEAEENDELPGFVASLARRAVESVSVWELLDALDKLSGLAGLLP